MTHTLHLGDCRDVLATMSDATVDAIVCDPPYELGFMGKAWDASGIAYDVTVWAQCLRVLKPGGHLIAFGGSRTYHRLAVAIEDAGFEIRDQIQWIYGSGFPKSLDVSKAMDKQAGAEREVLHRKAHHAGNVQNVRIAQATATEYIYSAPSTDLAKQWHGWGTALKPAHEPAVLARKPLRGTVADTVAQWGTGALNIEGTRVGDWNNDVNHRPNGRTNRKMNVVFGKYEQVTTYQTSGRWPSNVILDEEAAQVLDEQSGRSVSKNTPRNNAKIEDLFLTGKKPTVTHGHSDSGGASRFFYVAKASKAEREAGLHYEEWHRRAGLQGSDREGPIDPLSERWRTSPRANHHPTVKPLALMRYLVRMVTPPGGVVLDPFMGSGSTGCAAVREGFDFVGIDLTPEYVAIAQKRIDWHAVTSPLDGNVIMNAEESDA